MPKVEIYVSYAWRDHAKDPMPDDRETIVDSFCEECEKRGYTVKRDKTTVGYRENLERFMGDIGTGKYVVVVVSKKYLRSRNCMFEAVRMLMSGRFEERIFPIILPDANIFEDKKVFGYKAYWQNKLTMFSQKVEALGRSSDTAEMQRKERDYKDINERVLEFITQITKLNVSSHEIHLENGFADIFAALEKQIAADELPAVEITPSHPITSPQTFLERISQGLLQETISCFDSHRQQIDTFFQNPLKRVLLITGPNESGKTHLLRDVVREAAEQQKWVCLSIDSNTFDAHSTAFVNDGKPLLLFLDDAEWQEENLLQAAFRFVHTHPNTRLALTSHQSWVEHITSTAGRFKDFPGLICHIQLGAWKNEHLLQLLRLAAGGVRLENEEEIVRQFPNIYLLKYFGEASTGKTLLDVVGVSRNFSQKLRRVCKQALQPFLEPEEVESLLLFLVFHQPQDDQLTRIAPQFGLDEASMQMVFDLLKDANIIRRKRGTWYLFPAVKGDFYLASELEGSSATAIEAVIRAYLKDNEKAIFSKMVAASRYLSHQTLESTDQALANILDAWQKETQQQPERLNYHWIEAATEVLDLEDLSVKNTTNAACKLSLTALLKQTSPSSEVAAPESETGGVLPFLNRQPNSNTYGRFLETLVNIKRQRENYLVLVQMLWEAGWESYASNYQPKSLLANAFKPVYNDTESYKKGMDYARSWLLNPDQENIRQLGVLALSTLLGGFFEHISHEYNKMIMQTNGLPDNTDLYAIRDEALQIVREGIQQEYLHLDCLHIISQIGFGGRLGAYQDIFKLPSYSRIQEEIESMIPLVGQLLLASQNFLVQKEAEIILLHWWLLNISDTPELYLLRFGRPPEYVLYRYLTNGQYITTNFATWKAKAPRENRWEWYVKSDYQREKRQWKTQSGYFKPLVRQLNKRYPNPENIANFIYKTTKQLDAWLLRDRNRIGYAYQQIGHIATTWAGLHPNTFKAILADAKLKALLPEHVQATVENYLMANNYYEIQQIVKPLLQRLPTLTATEMGQLVFLIQRHQPGEKEVWLQQIIREGPEQILHDIASRLDFLFKPENETEKIAAYLLRILESGKITLEEFFTGRGVGGASLTYGTLFQHRAKLSPGLYENLRAATFDWVKKISDLEEELNQVLRFCIRNADHLIELIDYRASNWSIEQAVKNLDFHISHVLPKNTFSKEELLELFESPDNHRRFIDKIPEWERAAAIVFADWKDAYLNLKDPKTEELWIERHLRGALAGKDLEKVSIYGQYIPNYEQYIPLMLTVWQEILPTQSNEEMESLIYHWITKRLGSSVRWSSGNNFSKFPKVLWSKVVASVITNPRLKLIINNLSGYFEARWRSEDEE